MTQLLLLDATTAHHTPKIRAEHWGCPSRTRQWLPGLQLLTPSADGHAWYGRCLACGGTRRVWTDTAAVAQVFAKVRTQLKETP